MQLQACVRYDCFFERCSPTLSVPVCRDHCAANARLWRWIEGNHSTQNEVYVSVQPGEQTTQAHRWATSYSRSCVSVPISQKGMRLTQALRWRGGQSPFWIDLALLEGARKEVSFSVSHSLSLYIAVLVFRRGGGLSAAVEQRWQENVSALSLSQTD